MKPFEEVEMQTIARFSPIFILSRYSLMEIVKLCDILPIEKQW